MALSDSERGFPPAQSMEGVTLADDQFQHNLETMLSDSPTCAPSSSFLGGSSPVLEISNGRADTGPASDESYVPKTKSLDSALHSVGLGPNSLSGTAVGSSTPARTQDRTSSAGLKTVQMNAKLDSVKAWSVNAFRNTRQLINEKLGKGSKTVDAELDDKVSSLRQLQFKYQGMLTIVRSLSAHLTALVASQKALGTAFSELATTSPELQQDFTFNAETQRVLVKNGEGLLKAMEFFLSGMTTLCNKTMQDTLDTVKKYDSARLEYDACRNEYEGISGGPAPKDASGRAKMDAAQANFERKRVHFERLREDVSVKLKFLNDNRVTVMHKQLTLFHTGVQAYFTGNYTQLETTLQQFNSKHLPTLERPSWLEEQAH